jgi:restriction endonuclease S subunit
MTERMLEDICNILPRSKRNTRYGVSEGKYPFFKGSAIVDSFVDTPDYDGESIIIGDGVAPNVNYADAFSASDNCYIFQNKNKSVLNLKYAYYYLANNLDIMGDLYKGANGDIKHISKSSIKGIKIPVPSLEKQNEIVEYCENIASSITQLQADIQEKREQMSHYIRNEYIRDTILNIKE